MIGTNAAARWRARRNPVQIPEHEDGQVSPDAPPKGLRVWPHVCTGQLHGKKSWFSGAAGLILALPTGEYLAFTGADCRIGCF